MPGAVASWPLIGMGPMPAASVALIVAWARPSLAANTASTPLFGVDEDPLHDRLRFLVVPAGNVLVGHEGPVAGLHPGFDGLGVARRGTGTSCCPPRRR